MASDPAAEPPLVNRTVAGWADEWAKLLEDELNASNGVARRVIANRIQAVLDRFSDSKKDKTKPFCDSSPMTEEEARSYATTTTMAFGKHSGVLISEVPLEYLIWLADNSRDLWKALHRYLRSPMVLRQREIEDV